MNEAQLELCVALNLPPDKVPVLLHPDDDRVLYTFRYPLTAASTGRGLLDTLLRFANATTPEGAEIRPGSFPGRFSAPRGIKIVPSRDAQRLFKGRR